jgi:hypothetical protein
MRSRAPAFIINTKTKRNIVTETNSSISGHQDESTLNMFNKINEKNIFPCPILNEGRAPVINLPVPEFTYAKKTYNSNSDVYLKIHPKAIMPVKDDKQMKKFAENEVQNEVNFVTFMAMFDNENEISEVDIEQLLGIDMEKLGALKEKLENIIRYLKSLDLDSNGEKYKKDLINKLNVKIQEIRGNEENIKNVMCNVDKITKIKYGNKITKISFKK